MPKRELPKVGDKIAAKLFFVSKMNVRVDEAFGASEKDEALTRHLTWQNIVQPFKARPEGKGYGVFLGRRRFLAKMKSGAKTFEVGKDCLIEPASDEEALDASLRENLSLFRSELNPIARAKGISQLLQSRVVGIRSLARSWRIASSTLTEWLMLLELTPKLQQVVEKGLIYYTDALKVARLKLGKDLQDQLAELAENDGLDAFRSELLRRQAGKGRRGIPKDVYAIIRVTWDRRYPPDVKDLEKLKKLADAKGQEIDEYSKGVLREHIKSAA